MNIETTTSMRMLLVAVLALLTLPAAQAQTAEDAIRFTERSPATGARMVGMAGAGVAGLADYGAFFTNPAGLGYFRRSTAAGALNSVYTVDQSFYTTPGFSSTFDQDVSATSLGNLAYLYKAPTRQGSLVLGAALNQTHSFERDLWFRGANASSTISTSFLPFEGEYELDADGDLVSLADLPFAAFNAGLIEFFPEFLDEDPNAYPFLEAVVPGSTIEQTGNVVEEGRVSELSLGGAAEAARDVMVGLSANLSFGSYDFLSRFQESDINDENRADDYSVLLDNGDLLEGFESLTYRQHLRTDLVGINLRAGVSARLGDAFRLGATLETPTFYSLDEQFGQDFQVFFDQGGSLEYGEGFQDVSQGVFEYEITTPWRLGLGVGFEAGGLAVLADAEFIDWSQLELDAQINRAFFDELNRQIAEDYAPVVNTRLGLEYAAGALRLRGGVAFHPDPLDLPSDSRFAEDRFDNGRLRCRDSTTGQSVDTAFCGEDRDKVFISAGFGYRFDNQFQIDFGWLQSRFDSLYAPYPEDGLGPRQDDVLLVDEEVVQNQFVLGVSFFF